MGCTSLVSVYSNFDRGYKYLNHMLHDCHSFRYLTSGLYNFFARINAMDVGYMFSGCFSLTSIDLSRFDTENVINYEGLFYNCKNLNYVDISSFKHNNLPETNLSIFDNSYISSLTVVVKEDFADKITFPQNSTISNK